MVILSIKKWKNYLVTKKNSLVESTSGVGFYEFKQHKIQYQIRQEPLIKTKLFLTAKVLAEKCSHGTKTFSKICML
jgi:hypothetical protein